MAAKVTGITGNNIQLQLVTPTTEVGDTQVITIDRTQLANAPADLKVGQKLNLDIIKPETLVEFKVIPTVNEGGQTLAAKITGITGNNIQLQVFTPTTTEAGNTKDITIDRTQLTNAPTDLKVGQKLNLAIIKPETLAEFKVIPANEGGQVLAAKITGITGNNIQLQVFSPTATEAGDTQVITIDRTQLTNAPADLKVGQNLNLAVIKPETAPEFKIIPVANNIPEAKITEFIKQFLPRHEASPIFLNQLIKDLPQLMKNKMVPQTLKDIAAKIIGNLPPKEQLITSQGLKQAIANSGLFLEAKLPLAMPQAELIKALPQLIKNESVPKSLQRIAVEILQNLTQKEPVPNPLVLEQTITKSALIPEAELASLKLNLTDVEGAGVSQVGALAGNALQVDDFKENLLKFIHALKQEISLQSEQQHNQVDLDLLKNLQNKTENTVAKIVLDQLMSLPKDDNPKQLWIVDIPFIDRQQAETVKIEIQQDKENRQQFESNNWSVNITITPPELGTIHCIVSYRNNVINTYFKTLSTQTTELIKSNLDYLKKQLEESGLTTGHMDAHAGSQKTQVPHQLTGQKLFDENA
ncbi:MAG: flagellar hook-length control protein FliK [Methylobacter sp.]|nr:MAG: flagellar hook-length control protein FliK [Methylobacter sp.]